MMPKVICMVGLSNSGKTREIERMLVFFRRYDIPAVAINRDSLHMALHGTRYNASMNDEVSRLEVLYAKACFLYGYKYIIIDACHYTQEYRRRWIDICEREGWELKFKVIKTPVAECIRRAKAKSDDYIIEVIKRQAEKADFWEME